MKVCPQTKDLNVLEHGQMVWEHTKRIISGDWEGMKIPDWFKENFVKIISNLHDIKVIKQYNIYHDCGKPYCLEYDENGKKHFPNHAQKSKQVWLQLFPKDLLVSNLMGWDMCLHTETAEEIKAHNWDVKTAMTLLVTAMAEIHANSTMFGGIDSTSFKIKWKKINKRGKMLIKHFFPNVENHEYVYVIVRKDLSDPQKAVQGTHAAIEATKKFNLSKDEHPSVIYLRVKNEYQLKKAVRELMEAGINLTIFSEPDVDYEITAITTEVLSGKDRDFLKKYRLLH